MAKARTKITWFDVGYKEGREGKSERPPEGVYGMRCQYREDWLKGRTDRVQAGEGSPAELETFVYDEAKMFPFATSRHTMTD